ncbi:hypothetical protein ACQ5SI_02355 [Peribacillus frigoritolerans]|uniref:hypothetical protein n=1 Tax=Peribacillus frigoritolerans TaxID=450367 RepID=UPI003D32E64F
MAKKPHEKINELLQKAEDIKAGYAEGKETAMEEVADLKEELATVSEQVKELHKAYILNQITADAYNAEKKALEVLAEKVKDAEAKVSLIDNYEREDLQKVFYEIKELDKEYTKQKQQADSDLYKKSRELKKQYLDSIAEASKEYIAIHRPNYRIGELEVDAGLTKMNYQHGSGNFHTTMASNWYTNEKGAVVTVQELEDAFYRRK